MGRVTLRINRAKLHGVGMDEARKKVNRVVRRTYTRSQVLTPVDTGNLRASGRMDLGRDMGALVIGGVTYQAEYAAAVHDGRRAVVIRPKRPGGRLKFTVGGRTVYARQVRQPARAGRPFLAQALREVAPVEGFRVTIG
ncbi:MAG TPA: hypothetical protein VFU47_02720 [Armatimonadota bacterium]|nr:hypothetical protein [Armatimonadota bacterium]